MGDDDEQAADPLLPVEQDTIPFYGHELVAVRLESGTIAAVLRWLCESLNLNQQSQLRSIRGRTALAEGLVQVRVQTEGGPQIMPALTLKVLPGWLFAVDERRVKLEAREDLVRFQRECVDVLAEHFARKHRSALPAPADSNAVAIAEQIETLQGVVTLLREHLEALQGLPGQVDEMHQQLGQAVALLEGLAERQSATETRLDTVDTRTRQLTPAHARAVQEAVDRLVHATKHLPTPLTYATIYGRLKHRFRAGSYREVPDERFDELMAWLGEELARATRGEAPQQGSLF